jgi:hypothetical protein
MKKYLIVLFLVSQGSGAFAQAAEVTQLVLNIQKLNQLRQILNELKAGYEILSTGYTTIKNISEGNFKLHDAFLGALLEVSPAVKNYSRVKDIIDCQLAIMKEYRQVLPKLASSGQFTASELDYIGQLYSGLAGSTLENIDALTMVLTAKKLRASDDERLRLIDQIYDQVSDRLVFLRHFNSNAMLLSAQRQNDRQQTMTLQDLLDIKQ